MRDTITSSGCVALLGWARQSQSPLAYVNRNPHVEKRSQSAHKPEARLSKGFLGIPPHPVKFSSPFLTCRVRLDLPRPSAH